MADRELVNRAQIQEYATRNTSKKIPEEKLYLQAFTDAMLNSTSLIEVVDIMKSSMQNGEAFTIFNSFDPTAKILNKEPFRSIIAYAMLKKDLRLFELISAALFTGSVEEYHGEQLFEGTTKTTDESPVKYTDKGLTTDMEIGKIFIGFKNIFSTEVLEDGTGSEYQTLEEIDASMEVFDYLITLTKPARVQVLLFYIPYCFLGGTEDTIKSINIQTSDEDDHFISPFGDAESMRILNAMSDAELIEQYQDVTYFDFDNMGKLDIESERTIIKGEGFITFQYDVRIQSDTDPVWKHIQIKSGDDKKSYYPSRYYTEDTVYYEKYTPIMLRINDNDPNGPILAFQIENEEPTIGAMFYIREPKS